MARVDTPPKPTMHSSKRENGSPPPGTIRMVATPSTILTKCSG